LSEHTNTYTRPVAVFGPLKWSLEIDGKIVELSMFIYTRLWWQIYNEFGVNSW